VKLLEQGEISYERPAASRYRRVPLYDVLDYQERKTALPRSALDELTSRRPRPGCTTRCRTTRPPSRQLADR